MAPGNTTTCIEEIWKEFPGYTQYQVRSALAKCGLTTKHIESQVRGAERRGAGEGKVM